MGGSVDRCAKAFPIASHNRCHDWLGRICCHEADRRRPEFYKEVEALALRAVSLLLQSLGLRISPRESSIRAINFSSYS